MIQLNRRRIRVDISDSHESTGQYQFSDIAAWNASGNLLLWNDANIPGTAGRRLAVLLLTNTT
ncbi:hypothetical protein FM036_46170 [Nostoc sp. HG1]|nr:hypothetical protein [Nostoc sp. HG1]